MISFFFYIQVTMNSILNHQLLCLYFFYFVLLVRHQLVSYFAIWINDTFKHEQLDGYMANMVFCP